MAVRTTRKSPLVLHRGAILWVNLSPTKGHEQSGRRPAIVVSAERFNRSTGLAIVVPITSKGRGTAMEVVIETDTVHGIALASHVRAIDFSGRGVSIDSSSCPEEALSIIQGMLITFIGGIEL